MYYMTTYEAPIGTLTIACEETGAKLVGLWLAGQKYYGGLIAKKMTRQDQLPLFDETKEWLSRYFAGEQPDPAKLPLAPIGQSEFRRQVWQVLREIPYGSVMTYREIGKKVADLMGKTGSSSQAVGGAVGHNPISIIIPCHRVIGASGSLTGYAGGLPAKIHLLQLEGVATSRFFIPKRGTAL